MNLTLMPETEVDEEALRDAWLTSFIANLAALGVPINGADLACVGDELMLLFDGVHPAEAAAACAPRLASGTS